MFGDVTEDSPFIFQGAADLHVQGPRLPHRPEDEAVVDRGLGRRRQRLLLLRLVARPLQDHLRRGHQGASLPDIWDQNPWGKCVNHPSCSIQFSGCHQLNHHTEHDLHENVAKVRAVVRRPGEHSLRARIRIGNRAEQGQPRASFNFDSLPVNENRSRTHFLQMDHSPCSS